MELIVGLMAVRRLAKLDLCHALLASAADVFVTGDERLASLLARVPLDSFRVVVSLDALLAD